MSYSKTTWVNDTNPAINATNLNKIEQGIYDVTEESATSTAALQEVGAVTVSMATSASATITLAGSGQILLVAWKIGTSTQCGIDLIHITTSVVVRPIVSGSNAPSYTFDSNTLEFTVQNNGTAYLRCVICGAVNVLDSI